MGCWLRYVGDLGSVPCFDTPFLCSGGSGPLSLCVSICEMGKAALPHLTEAS